MKESIFDTIAALATPAGEGGISVIRISGANAFNAAEKFFRRDKEGKQTLKIINIDSHTIHYGYFVDGKEQIDEVLISIFKSPNSYTGEDVLEISSHGSMLIVNKILEALLKENIRRAAPGEFTKRAFLNGRMDLSQAEAVADLIKAKTEDAHKSSLSQLEGSLSKLVQKIRQQVINFASLVELELDFAEEELEFVKKDELKNKILELTETLKDIIESYISGRIIRDGIKLVIAGKPNSGKSSLFNHLLRSNRAIVSDIAGTTRDYIEESLIINGILFTLVDTAGLRISEDIIESEGIKRSFEKIKDADLILYLADSSEDGKSIDENINYYKSHFNENNSLLVYTKKDVKEKSVVKGISISLFDENSIEALKKAMVTKVNVIGSTKSAEVIITNQRHKLLLEQVNASLLDAVKSIDDKMSGEFIAIDLRNALSHLGEITGETTNDDILNNIFSTFCIGK